MRFLPWAISGLCFIALAASSSEIHRLKTKLAAFHDHKEVREFMIRAALADVKEPIVIFGDSITEMAPLPREICGHPVINAGIGGLSTSEAIDVAPRILSPAYVIALAFGANGGDGAAQLIERVKTFTTRVVSISDTVGANEREVRVASLAADVPHIDPIVTAKMPDGIHYTAAAYKIWIPAMEREISTECAGAAVD